ncbi:J domain-containing protein [Listeria portnoyi]|uniref:J domain-containing protein n=1 Tax=Listeria portnoyi TaxID=2713504 RepID=UPI001C9D2F97|nr:J domain-containing protein [Listeria portnoyi]
MNCWEMLNIEVTVDKKKIKSAYAKKLKITHPDDDLKAFQELKQAFDAAMIFAKNGEIEQYEIENTPNLWTENKEEVTINESELVLKKDENPTFQELVQSVFNNFEKRVDVGCWKLILDSSIEWDMYQYNANRDLVKELLLDYHATIPQPVIQLLFEHFALQMVDEKHFVDEERHIFENHMEEIFNIPNFSFQFPERMKGMVREQFLSLRYAAYRSLRYGKLTEAKQLVEQAEKIFDRDADLCTLEGMVLFYGRLDQLQLSNGTFKRSFRCFEKALAINSAHETARFYAILIRSKQTGKVSDKRRQFLDSFQGGYVLQLNLFLGFIYYFAEDYGNAVRFWTTLPIEHLTLVKKEWGKSLRQQIRVEEKLGNKEQVSTLRRKLTESKQLEGEKVRSWRWLKLIVIYLVLIGLFKACTVFVPSSSTAEPVYLTEYDEMSGETFRKPTSAEIHTQAGLVSRFVTAFDMQDEESKREELIESIVALDYRGALRDHIKLPAFKNYTERVKEQNTLATDDGIYTLLLGSDESDLIIVSKDGEIVKVMGGYFDTMDEELLETIKQK